MYNQNPRVRDAQNPYRTGVLIGNCWEDKFGMELATKTVSELIAHLVTKQVSPIFNALLQVKLSANVQGS